MVRTHGASAGSNKTQKQPVPPSIHSGPGATWSRAPRVPYTPPTPCGSQAGCWKITRRRGAPAQFDSHPPSRSRLVGFFLCGKQGEHVPLSADNLYWSSAAQWRGGVCLYRARPSASPHPVLCPLSSVLARSLAGWVWFVVERRFAERERERERD